MSDKNSQDAVSLIYQATLEPELWYSVMEQLAVHYHESNDHTDKLAEHCRRAMAITQELHHQQEHINTWKLLVDYLPMSIFFVDQQLNFVASNARGERMLDQNEYFSLDIKHRFKMKTPLFAKHLTKQLKTIHNQAPQPLILDHEKKVILIAVPIRKVEMNGDLMGASAALLVFTADEKITPDRALIRDLHQLTHAETKLTHSLCLTHSLSDAAKLSDISLSTARSYLKTIYSKTSSSSQLELVRKVVASSFASFGLACASQLNQDKEYTFELPDQRLLSWFEYGDPNGKPLVVFENIGGSLPTHHQYQTQYQALGLRVIVIIRPGYGGSTSKDKLDYISFAHDAISLLDYLKVQQFLLIGYSMGGAYAATLAALYSDRVSHLGLLCSALPWDYINTDALAPHHKMMAKLAGFAPDLFEYVISLMMRSAYKDPAQFYIKMAQQVDSVDKHVLLHPKWQNELTRQLKQRLFGGVKVYAQEYRLLSQGWGVSPDNITCPTLIWHGQSDRLVSCDAMARFSREFPLATFISHPEQGHFMPCKRWLEFVSELNFTSKNIRKNSAITA